MSGNARYEYAKKNSNHLSSIVPLIHRNLAMTNLDISPCIIISKTDSDNRLVVLACDFARCRKRL